MKIDGFWRPKLVFILLLSWSITANTLQQIPFGFFGGSTSCGGAPIKIYLTSGSSWTVPSDWCNSNNSIEVIGGGGSGAAAGATYYAGGGGGGAYSKVTNLSLTPGTNVSYSVGLGGTAVSTSLYVNGNAGGDTYFGSGSCVLSIVCARGGSGGQYGLPVVAATGGSSASGVGSTKYSGGNGGSGNGGTGGGGAAGPSAAGLNAPAVSGGNSGAGGSANGGAGGAGGDPNGSPGLIGNEFGSSYGSGGGGGGTYALGCPGTRTGGSGGNYGGGGGGGSNSGYCAGVSGAGANGLIIITYSP